MQANSDLNVTSIQPSARRLRCIVGLISCVGVIGLAAACSADKGGNRSSQAISAAVDRVDEGVTTGPTGGSTVNSPTYQGLDDQELHRLRDAARQAFAAGAGVTTSYTIVPKNIDAEPTAVAATPAGPQEVRADGTCRPIRLSVTKNGRTTTGTLTFCQAPGTTDIKPAKNI